MEQVKKHICMQILSSLPFGLMLAALLVACSHRSDEPEPLAIRLYTGIQTRAAVDAFQSTPVGIACGTVSGVYSQCWDGIATDNEITLTPTRYYPQDGSTLYLRSFYPPAPLGEDGTLTYTLTGEEDLMMTSEQNGSQDAPFASDADKVLTHRHLLTKLGFRLKLDADNPEQYRIRSLHLDGLAQEVTLSLLTEELHCSDNTSAVKVYMAAAEDSGLPFEEGVAELPSFVLVQPGAEFTIDLRLAVDDNPENDLNYTDLPISFEGGSGGGGIAYTVSVDIPDPDSLDPVEAKATATVSSWGEGSGGSGDLQ